MSNSYIRFVWYRVENSLGEVVPQRWALNVSNPSTTLEEYLAKNSLKVLAGPFKTRKAAME
jgi:hypothetical protein